VVPAENDDWMDKIISEPLYASERIHLFNQIRFPALRQGTIADRAGIVVKALGAKAAAVAILTIAHGPPLSARGNHRAAASWRLSELKTGVDVGHRQFKLQPGNWNDRLGA
jgi:hypothetical protein